MGRTDPSPNAAPRQIRLTRMDRLTVMNWRPKLSRSAAMASFSSTAASTRIPSGCISGGIAGVGIMDRANRLTRKARVPRLQKAHRVSVFTSILDRLSGPG